MINADAFTSFSGTHLQHDFESFIIEVSCHHLFSALAAAATTATAATEIYPCKNSRAIATYITAKML